MPVYWTIFWVVGLPVLLVFAEDLGYRRGFRAGKRWVKEGHDGTLPEPNRWPLWDFWPDWGADYQCSPGGAPRFRGETL